MVHIPALCGFRPTTTITILRGVGGVGKGVSAGSGDGVRDLENMFDKRGNSGTASDSRWEEVGSVCGGGGAAAKVMARLDSASKVSPRR